MLMINLLFYQSGCRVRVYDVLHLLQQRHVLGPAHPRILLRPPRLHPLHQLRRIHGPRSRNRRASLHRIRINIDTICFRNLFGDSAAFWMSDCYFFVPKRLFDVKKNDWDSYTTCWMNKSSFKNKKIWPDRINLIKLS